MEEWFDAAARNDVQYIKHFMHYFINMTYQAQHCKTALMIAAYAGNCEIVRLLAHHERLMKASNGFTALMYATVADNIECIHVLAPLESNQRSLKSEKAIEIAARKGRVDAFKILWNYEGEESIYVHDNQQIRSFYESKTRKSAAQSLTKSQLLWYYMPDYYRLTEQLLLANSRYSKQLQVLQFYKSEYLKTIEVMNYLSRNDDSEPEEQYALSEDFKCAKTTMRRNYSAVYLGSLSKNLSFEQLLLSGVHKEQKMRNIIILMHGMSRYIHELRTDTETLLARFEVVFNRQRH